jgi:shikimate kinase
MPGAGKSSVGQELARQLNFRIIETDELIQQQTGLTLEETLERLGDELFIRLEEQIVLRLGELDRCIISTGGSVVYSPRAMEFLKRVSVVVFLKVPLEVILTRITPQRGTVRLRGRTLQDLFNERIPLYEKYGEQTICGDKDIQTVVEAIKRVALPGNDGED